VSRQVVVAAGESQHVLLVSVQFVAETNEK
jgi:hypothetical protein